MRQGFETNFCHKKKSVTIRPKGGKLKHMRNGFTAGFCHFLGTIKIWGKKTFFFFNNISCGEFLSYEILLEKNIYFLSPKHD
jgi:hypothetical protein